VSVNAPEPRKTMLNKSFAGYSTVSVGDLTPAEKIKCNPPPIEAGDILI